MTELRRMILSISAYRLYTVMPRLVKFVDQLTNWYVRMNRKRLKVNTTMTSRVSCLKHIKLV